MSICGYFSKSFLGGVGSSLCLVFSSSLFGLGLFSSLLNVSSSVCSSNSGGSATSKSSRNYILVFKSRRAPLFLFEGSFFRIEVSYFLLFAVAVGVAARVGVSLADPPTVLFL